MAQRPDKPFKRASIKATFYLNKRNDASNLIAWCKAVEDGLQDAGIIENDVGFEWADPHQVVAKKGPRKLVLGIEEIKEEL